MKKLMYLNKETAIRLWTQQFGKKQKAIDFAGREIAKAAYNDRNSNYGWNVDHILPQSRGGKTADYNLICYHIQTNDEKADKFPCFKANTEEFEIQKRQNHFEISLNCIKDIVEKQVRFSDSLVIDELVKINTSAVRNLKDISPQNGYYPYHYTFTELKRNLEKLSEA